MDVFPNQGLRYHGKCAILIDWCVKKNSTKNGRKLRITKCKKTA